VREQTKCPVQENSTLRAVGQARGAKYEATAGFENRKAVDDWRP